MDISGHYKKETMKKIIISHNTYQYDRLKAIEGKAIQAFGELKIIAEKTIGHDKVKMKDLLVEDPSKFLVNLYYDTHLKGILPEHLDKKVLFQNQNNITIENISQIFSRYKTHIDTLGKKYAPKIINNETVSNLKYEDFNNYLSEDKREHYNEVQELLAVIKKLRARNRVNDIGYLVRAFHDFHIVDYELSINPNDFM
mgnify:CR=1 FL=1|tara:strand:+ start:1084 stop:1677 length:594 start_codon:yes stop_codon:yes gene_type:complete